MEEAAEWLTLNTPKCKWEELKPKVNEEAAHCDLKRKPIRVRSTF